MRHKTVRRFAVLSGARRVGKTTILYQMIEQFIDEGINPGNILYVSFDNPIVKLVSVENVLSIYESLYPINGTRFIFLDEIQYTEDWEMWMKVIYDSRKDIRLTATGSASPILEKGTADSGTGRWSVLKIPTMSFYEYCRLLQLEEPLLPDNLRLTEFVKKTNAELGDLMERFTPLIQHFNRYLTIGGFPELVLSLFNIRSPLLMEKLFLYLCMNSTEIFSITTAAKDIGGLTIQMPAALEYVGEVKIRGTKINRAPRDFNKTKTSIGNDEPFVGVLVWSNSGLIPNGHMVAMTGYAEKTREIKL